MQEIDYTETDEFADSVIDAFCPPVAEEVGTNGGLLYGLVRTRKISPGPMFRREYARANQLEAENARLRMDSSKVEELLYLLHGNRNRLDILVGRTGDNEVSAKELAKILCAELSKVGNQNGKTERTVQNWDMYIKSGGKKGTHPPEGYTLDTRRTWEAAKTFATIYAYRESARLKKRVAFNDMLHSRNNTD